MVSDTRSTTTVKPSGRRNNALTLDEMEEQKILARRQRDEERTKKLHYGHLRRIGADIAGLQNQIQEKQKQKEKEKETEMHYMVQQENIVQSLSQMEMEIYEKKCLESLKLKEEYESIIAKREKEKKVQQEELYKEKEIDESKFTASSLQRFQGEDIEYAKRQYLQKKQMEEWIKIKETEKRREQAEIENQKREEKEKTLQMVEYITNVEKNEKIKNYLKLKEMQEQNLQEIIKKQERKKAQKRQDAQVESMEIEHQKASRLLRDEMPKELIEERKVISATICTDSKGKKRGEGETDEQENQPKETAIISEQFHIKNSKGYKDSWKGLSKETIRLIDENNYEIYMKEKAEKEHEDKMRERKEKEELERLEFQLESLEYHEKKKEIQRQVDIQKDIQVGMTVKHEEKRKEKEERNKSHNMDDFYNKFGTSFR